MDTYSKTLERDIRAKLAERGWYYRPRAVYDAGTPSRLNTSWSRSSTLTADQEIRTTLKLMRNGSRSLAQNDGYMKKFLSMCEKNISGPNGITLQSKIKNPDGTLDANANTAVESGWEDLGSRKNFMVTGRASRRKFERSVIRHVARDGEVLVRKVRGWQGNKFRLAFQLFEADYLDENFNVAKLANGNAIVMGIEFDSWGRRVAYHLWNKHPGDTQLLAGANSRVRVPADEIIHVFIQERETQNRGVPWIYAAMNRLQMLGGYEDAELVAARVTAAKPVFYKTIGAENIEASMGDSKDSKGNIVEEVEPGMARLLPPGVEPVQMDPNHPTQAFPYFLKAMLRGVASSVDVCYNYFASDLEGVNFSSMRSGALDERDAWKMLQGWIIEELHTELFEEYLSMGLLAGAITYTLKTGAVVPLPFRKMDKFNAPKWSPRGWDWVDPLNDIQANEKELGLGTTTRTRIASKKGEDFEDLLHELAQETKMIDDIGAQYGVDLWKQLSRPGEPKAAPAPQAPGDKGAPPKPKEKDPEEVEE